MTIIATDLRTTQEEARRIRFESTPAIQSTNVQDAIQQVGAGVGPTGTPVTVGMSPYTPLPSDTLLLVDTSAGPVTIQMPLAARVLDLEVKDATGNAVANPISVVRGGADLIDGLTTYSLDGAYAAAKFGPKAGGYFVHA